MKIAAHRNIMTIVLRLGLGIGLVVSASCRSDRSASSGPSAPRMSAVDNYPSWSPDGTRISFHSQRDGNREVYVMNADGSNQTRLTDNPFSDAGAIWSPDGQAIAFVSDRDGNYEIYTMNSNGSNQTRITKNPASDRFPSWSPDASRLVFQSTRDGNSNIYSINVDGSDLVRLTDNPAHDVSPSWSPDGKRIAFISDRDKNQEVYVMNADGSDQSRLTKNSASDFAPSWSPDGSKILFVSDRDENREIYIMNLGGSDQTRLTEEPSEDIYPSWSPDGRKIAFASDRAFDIEVFIMDIDGSNPVNLTNNAPIDSTVGLAPVPRSEVDLADIPYKIVFESYRETDGKENWEICMIDTDGSGFVNLTNSPDIDEMYPHASPDGEWICFVADEGKGQENKKRSVYYMKIGGTNRMKVVENAYQPCWSGDGSYIAYLPGEFPRYDRNYRANMGIEIYSLETGEARRHPNDQIKHIARLCWSPNGEWFIAAAVSDIPGRKNVFKADDKTMMRLQMSGCTPDISPDGKQFAWNGTDFNLNIAVLDFESPQANLTNHKVVIACEHDHWAYHADWSPDGQYLAFTYGTEDGSDGVGWPAPGANICVCDLSTGKWTLVTTDGKHNKEPDWVPLK